MKKLLSFGIMFLTVLTVIAQDIRNNPGSNHGNKFEQLGTILPTPNEYRTASGAPGTKYWQQRADYDIKATLDEKNLMLHGAETITYFNNSPDVLTYIWLQLDENEHSTTKNAGYPDGSSMGRGMSPAMIDNLEEATFISKVIESAKFDKVIQSCIFSSFRIDWNIFKEFYSFIHCHVQYIRNGFSFVTNFQCFSVETFSHTGFAFYIYIR